MASKAYLAKKDREVALHREDEAMKREHEKGKYGLLGSVINAGGRVLGSMAKVNDVSWYKTWPCDYSRFTNLPTWKNLATPTVADALASATFVNGTYKPISLTSFIPRVIALQQIPRLGSALSSGNIAMPSAVDFPLNNALSMMLTQIGKVNSRAVAADPDVLGLYLIGTGEIEEFLTWFRVNLEIAGYYETVNPGLRDVLLTARGVAVNDFVNHIADYRKLYNQYAVKFNTEFAIPDITYYRRKAFIGSAIFKDQKLTKGQIITFHRHMNIYGKVNADVDGVTYAKTSLSASSDYKAWLEDAFNRILYDGDFNTLVANIRAAYPSSKMLVLQDKVGDFVTELPVNEDFLSQLHNMTLLPFAPGLQSNSSASYTNLLSFMQVLTTGVGLKQSLTLTYADLSQNNTLIGDCWRLAEYKTHTQDNSDLLDFYKDDVNSDDILESTRLHSCYQFTCNVTHTGSDTSFVNSCSIQVYAEGTEMLICGTIYGREGMNTISRYVYQYHPLDKYGANPDTMDSTYGVVLSQAFDWMCPIYFVSTTGTATPSRTIYSLVVNQFGNYFNVDRESISKIHYVCDQSLWFSDPSNFSFKG